MFSPPFSAVVVAAEMAKKPFITEAHDHRESIDASTWN